MGAYVSRTSCAAGTGRCPAAVTPAGTSWEAWLLWGKGVPAGQARSRMLILHACCHDCPFAR